MNARRGDPPSWQTVAAGGSEPPAAHVPASREPVPPAPAGAAVRISSHLRIPLDELEWRFSGSGGPGGQHANTSNTRVEVRFDVAASPSLGPRQRARLLERLGPVVRVVAADERSQHRNRALAIERLRDRLVAALAVERPRVATRPSRSARERRLEDKRRRAARKRERRGGPEGD